jgi:ketol-acid reductoisomerase
MAKIFYDDDASLDPLRGLEIAVIGYGNQGRAHAQNLRDSGLQVVVCARANSSAETDAKTAGFAVLPIEDATISSAVLAFMLPDECIPEVYASYISPRVQGPKTFVFAHGFAVRGRLIDFRDDADVLLIAPTGPGRQLRTLYQAGKGLPALIAVEQDASKQAFQRCLAYAKGIGSLRAGAISTTFEEETVTDLFCEQAVLCGGLPELIKASFETLVKSGYQPELAYISCLKEVKLIADLLFEIGIDGMRAAISNTAKFGSAKAGPRIINNQTREVLATILQEIESGKFAKGYLEESKDSLPTVKSLMVQESTSQLAQTGKQLKESLRF